MVKYLLSLDKLKQNQESNYYLLKADFLWKVTLKVSLKMPNSGIILKTFTHVSGLIGCM